MFILRIDMSQDPYARGQVTFAVAGAILISDTQLFNLLPSKFRWDFGVFLEIIRVGLYTKIHNASLS